MFDIIDSFAKGYRYINNDTIRGEDFGKTYKSDLCQIFAVADGHGDPNCPRSSFGSETACNAAISGLMTFCEEVFKNSLESEILESDKRIKHLIEVIVAEWSLAVKEDYENNPLSDEERAGCDRYLELYDNGEKIEHIYGTTLIAGLMTDKYLLLLQQGDGRCDVFNDKGEVSQPIPWDEKCLGNITTSLCESDAIQRFRHCIIDIVKHPIIACIADTDGVEDSFGSMGLLHNFHRDLLIYACEHGIESLHEHLKEILPELTKERSRDDITICGFVDLEKTKGLIPAFKKANEIVDLENRLREVDARLKSMRSMGKMEALKAQYEKACEEVEKIRHAQATVLDEALANRDKKEQEYKDYQKREDQLNEERLKLTEELALLNSKGTCEEANEEDEQE